MFAAELRLLFAKERPETALDVFDVVLNASLVFRFVRKTGIYQKAVMLGEFLIRPVDDWRLERRFDHRENASA